MDVSVSFIQTEFRTRDISKAAVVVIDCFRASTCIVKALNCGAKAVYPHLSVAEAIADAKSRPGAVLAGERGGVRIEGFQLGNSPREYSREIVGGRDVVMTTTNGTKLLTAAAKAQAIYVAAFANVTATADALARQWREVIIAAAGTEGHFSVEDSLCAGLLVTHLAERAGVKERDSAIFARLAYASARGNLRAAVEKGRGAGNIRAIGLEPDIDDCLEVDSRPIVAMALPDPLRVMRIETA